MFKNKKSLILLGFISSLILLAGCNNNEVKKESDTIIINNEIKFIEDESKQVKINEEEYFEATWEFNQLITKTNNMFIDAEYLLQNKDVDKFNEFSNKIKNEKISEEIVLIENKINEFTMHESNDKYNESLDVVKKNLLDGLEEYRQSLVFVENELLSLYNKEVIDEEEILELENRYKESYQEQRIVFNGNIEQMQQHFKVADENFIYFIGGQYEKNYGYSLFRERMMAYFENKQ